MTQPLLGVVATALVVALSLGYVAIFDVATFVGWVSFVMLCLIPAQIVTVVLAPNPPFAMRPQPGRGIALLAVTTATGVIIAPAVLQIVGDGIRPPGPIPSQFAVIVVPTMFFMAIAFGGWPFTKFTRNGGVLTALMLLGAYAVTYGVFHLFFDYGFLAGTPVFLASAPAGAYHGVFALVFYVTALAGMFLLLHFDLWPLTRVRALIRQPVLGIAWLAVSLVLAAGVMWLTTDVMALDPMYVLTRITAPFIFGTIVVLNMLQNSLFARLTQPAKGVANALSAAVIGAALAQIYGLVSPALVGPLSSGPPGYEYELWLVNALLSVTFPFLIFHAAYFAYWPLARQTSAAPAEAART